MTVDPIGQKQAEMVTVIPVRQRQNGTGISEEYWQGTAIPDRQKQAVTDKRDFSWTLASCEDCFRQTDETAVPDGQGEAETDILE